LLLCQANYSIKFYPAKKIPAKSRLKQEPAFNHGPFQALKKAVGYFANCLPATKTFPLHSPCSRFGFSAPCSGPQPPSGFTEEIGLLEFVSSLKREIFKFIYKLFKARLFFHTDVYRRIRSKGFPVFPFFLSDARLLLKNMPIRVIRSVLPGLLEPGPQIAVNFTRSQKSEDKKLSEYIIFLFGIEIAIGIEIVFHFILFRFRWFQF